MPEFTIGELVEATGVPARTVRYYQSIGLLDKPRRVGKEAAYTDAHVDRLRLIADMQRRGMKLGAIADVLTANPHARNSAADWLGLDALRSGPSDEAQSTFDDNALSDLLGDRRDEILDDLIAADYLSFRQGRWHVRDLPILKAAIVLYDGGVSVALSTRLRDSLRQRLESLADEAVRAVVKEAGAGYAGEATFEDLLRNVDRFRAAAWEAAGHVMAHELERAIKDIRDRGN